MIKIQLSVYKYGSFIEFEDHEFNNYNEFNEWLNSELEYTDEKKRDESLCNESLCKWSATFTYNNKPYRIYLDC